MGINQQIKPTTFHKDTNISVGGCDLTVLANEYGTPLYVVDEATIRGICREYKEAFKNYKNIKMTFASKALCNLAISKIFIEEGFSFDTVSAGEIYTVYKAGANMSNVTFNGNNKSYEELNIALNLKIGRFSVDNFYEAELLNSIAEENFTKADILLRITPGIECHTHEYIKTGQIDSKFGFDMSQVDEIINLIITKYKNLNIKGLHAHIGSQIFEIKPFEDEVEILIREMVRINTTYGLNINELNIGGGLGVKYTEHDNPPSIENFAKSVIGALETSCKRYGVDLPLIYIEPGRSLISTAGVTLYTIGSAKQVQNGKKYITVDGGMADNPRPITYQAKYTAEIVNDTSGRVEESVTIAGKFCESGDILIENIKLPAPKTGDILCIYNTGAYNYSMSSNYNRAKKPAMILVNNSQSDIIVNRESLEDLVRLEKVPNRLKNNDR